MVGAGVYVDLYAGAGGDAKRLLAWAQLVATDVLAGYVSNEAVVLVILRLADSRPGRSAVDDGKSVCENLVGAVVQDARGVEAYSERWPRRRQRGEERMSSSWRWVVAEYVDEMQ